MKRIDIKTGYSCNNNCRFCILTDKRTKYRDRSTVEVMGEIETAKRENFDKIVLTGGEITIRKDFFKLLKFASKQGFKVIHIESNGRMFKYKDFTEKTIKAGATHFTISLHAGNPESYAYLTDTSKEAFREVIQGIKNLKKFTDNIGINCTINKINYKELPDVITLCHELKINSVNFPFVNPRGNAWKNRKEIVPRFSKAIPFLHKSIDLAEKLRIGVSTEMIPLCFMQGYEGCVEELRKKMMTVSAPEHIDEDFVETRKKGKTKAPQCAKCSKNRICEGFMENYKKIFGVEEFKPIYKTQRKRISLEKIKKLWRHKLTNNFNEKKELFNLYIDSPFCFYPKCRYCAYNPVIIKDIKLKDKYYNTILIDNIRDFKDILSIRTPDTVYFGGGSSSLMSLKQMKRIFNELQKYFDFKNKIKEKTFELNPLHITNEKIELLNKWNFTNLTIGIQTFNKKILDFNYRVNPPLNKIKEIFKLFEKVTYQYNMDLMTFIYKGNLEEDLKVLKKDLEITTKILKPTRITIFPNYHQIDPKDPTKPPKATLEKITALRKCIKKFDKGEYKVIGWMGKATNLDYRTNYYLLRKDRFKDIIYNCSAWEGKPNFKTCIINQNVLALGGYGKRTPYSYFSNKLCYYPTNIGNHRSFVCITSPKFNLL
ncbi:MAG: radical SAM protein [Nanoarchaeota archaeon]|nr:radical SAM protein [Nanoarchaeota archaeon]